MRSAEADYKQESEEKNLESKNNKRRKKKRDKKETNSNQMMMRQFKHKGGMTLGKRRSVGLGK